jgi:hypothetical protein
MEDDLALRLQSVFNKAGGLDKFKHCLLIIVLLAAVLIPSSVKSECALVVMLCAIVAAILAFLNGFRSSSKEIHQSANKDETFDARNFPLGLPEAAFVRTCNQMALLEERVASIYAKDDKAPALDVKGPLDKLRQMVQPLERADWTLREPLDDIMLCRLLIATDFKVDKAFSLADRYVQFRRNIGGGLCPPSDWVATGAILIPFEDRWGRPVVVVRAKYLDAYNSELLERGYRATLDTLIAHLLSKRGSRISQSNPLEQYVVALHVEGATWRNWSTSLVRMMVGESQRHYPERLAQIFVLGCNSFVRGMWGLSAPLLHPRTTKKVKMVGQSEIAGFMQGQVEDGTLPQDLGGSAPALVHPAAANNIEELAGKIAADTWERLNIAPRLHRGDSKDQLIMKEEGWSNFCCLRSM